MNLTKLKARAVGCSRCRKPMPQDRLDDGFKTCGCQSQFDKPDREHALACIRGQRAEGSYIDKKRAWWRRTAKQTHDRRRREQSCIICAEPMPKYRLDTGFDTCGCQQQLACRPAAHFMALIVQDAERDPEAQRRRRADREKERSYQHEDSEGRRASGIEVLAKTRGHICYACGETVNVLLDGREPDGPTIEHIVPRVKFKYGRGKVAKAWQRIFPAVQMPRGFSVNHPANLAISHSQCNTNTRPLEPHPNWVEEQKWRGTYPV